VSRSRCRLRPNTLRPQSIPRPEAPSPAVLAIKRRSRWKDMAGPGFRQVQIPAFASRGDQGELTRYPGGIALRQGAPARQASFLGSRRADFRPAT
jgi:hypothetical protein